MKNIYHSEFLSINHDKSEQLFVLNWLKSPNTINEFKCEMLNYVRVYSNSDAKHVIWLQQNFTIRFQEEDLHWIEKNVNKKCFVIDHQKTAFVVGKDAMAHFGVMDSFEKTGSEVKNIRHFADELSARNWIFNTEKNTVEKRESKISYKGIDKNGFAIIELKRPAENLGSTLKEIKDILEEHTFITQNINKFMQLTKREKEIFAACAQNKKHAFIAEELNISIHTTRTHWRNIKGKLNIKSFADVQKYAKNFPLHNHF